MCLEAGGTRAFILKCLRGGQLPGSESESVMAPVTGNPSLIPAIYTAEDRSVTLSLFPLSSRTDVFCLPAVQPSGLNCPFNARDPAACLGKFSSAFVRLTLNIYMTGSVFSPLWKSILKSKHPLSAGASTDSLKVNEKKKRLADLHGHVFFSFQPVVSISVYVSLPTCCNPRAWIYFFLFCCSINITCSTGVKRMSVDHNGVKAQ